MPDFGGNRSSETYLAAVVFYVFLLSVWVMRIFLLPSFSDDVFLRLLRFALSLTLSHGERGQIAESPIMVNFQHHHSLSPWERARERVKPQI